MKLWPLTWTRVRQGIFNRRHIWRTKRAGARASRVARSTPPMPVRVDSDIEVHMLLCHRDVGMCLQGLKSLFRFAPDRFALVLHDDGSLTPEDRACLAHHFPGVRVIEAPDAARRVDSALAALGLERCRALRRTFVLAPKVFDCALYSAGKMMLLIDADVIFLERPSALLDALARTDAKAPMRFNIDVRRAYVWTDDEIRAVTGFVPAPELNSGLVAMRYDPDVLPELWGIFERCLALPVPPALRWLTEQTLIGIAGGWHGAVALPPEYDVCARLLRTGREDLVSHHCLAHQRLYMYQAFLTHVAPMLREPATGSAHSPGVLTTAARR